MKEQETIADIIAEMRRIRVREFQDYADRFEAAHRRELSKNASKNGANFGQLGDAAKLREALEFCVKGMCGFCRMDAEARGMTTECVNGCEALRKAKAALSDPPRNCDVGTWEEQSMRFEKFCDANKCLDDNGNKECSCRCPACHAFDCSIFWSQMPYTEGGAK